MANKNRKPKLHRHLPLIVSVLLSLPAAVLSGDIDPSHYSPFVGDKFYLLTETTFNSEEVSKVRLEVPGNKESLGQYSGVDVRVYKIDNPLEFLKKQKDLHRPTLKGNYAGEGLSNALNYLWDSWYKKSRLAWQRIFSFFARSTVVEKTPELKQTPAHTYQTKFQNNPQFGLMGGLELVSEYRFPLWKSKPIAPPSDVKLSGSSSNFLEAREGNVYVPIGKQKPGLYLVEAIIGTFRATTFLFVSDTVAITKLSGDQELVWSVDKKSGKPVSDTRLLFSDGVGSLGEGKTQSDGVFVLDRKNLERSYVFGQDKSGGVFISENFYYDSEIYGNKVYMFTDRPLYKPGDEVHLKLVAREFKNSFLSVPVGASSVALSVIDSEGVPMLNGKIMKLEGGVDGGEMSFKLPIYARAGGYTLHAQYSGASYVANFRVGNYVKPHFEVDIGFDKRNYSVSESIKGKVSLNYPNGSPVKDAFVEIQVRKQKLTMVEGELQYLDRFPIQVSKNTYASNGSGVVEFTLPEAKDPSRYVLSVRAIDKTSYRVLTSKELLVQVSSAPMIVSAKKKITVPGESVAFRLESKNNSEKSETPLASWELVRLQDQSKTTGKLSGDQKDFSITFDKGGSYTLAIKDKQGVTVATANHWVQGPELAYVPGTISILLDKEEYDAGDTAKALITFSQDVSEALVTFERDKVENHLLLSASNEWVKLSKVSSREFKAEIPVRELLAPNITFSVAYVSGGRYFFENKGIRINVPKIVINMHPDKNAYQPGETVNVQVDTTWKGKPIESTLTVGVVDEMIYVLQPEIAPDIADFFFHPRRNQVRTSSSLSFHSYDVAVSATGAVPSTSSSSYDRSLKLKERPRREEKDTAFWDAKLKTNAEGKAKFSFVMPDSLTRWRMTAKAIAMNGFVGQKQASILSQKDVYAKWSGPTSFRQGDEPSLTMALFNFTQEKKEVAISGSGVTVDQKISLAPGPNYVSWPWKALKNTDAIFSIQDKTSRKNLDQLAVSIQVVPVGWVNTKTSFVSANALEVPEGAFNIRLSAASGSGEAFFRAADDLLEYPYGCVEQVSSRLLPLAIAYSSVAQYGVSPAVTEKIKNRLIEERLRLIKLAGPSAYFSWWGDETEGSAFMTAYAYYADWLATKALDINVSQKDWDHLLDAYKKYSDQEPLLAKAIILWMAAEMKLPVKTLTEGVVEEAKEKLGKSASPLFAFDTFGENAAAALVLDVVAKKTGVTIPGELSAKVEEAKQKAKSSESPLAVSAYLLSRGTLSPEEMNLGEKILNAIKTEQATIERGVSLAFLSRAMGVAVKPSANEAKIDLGKDWKKIESKLGRTVWQYRSEAALSKVPEIATKQAGSLQLVYDSYQKEPSSLPIKVSRKFYLLTPKENPLDFEMKAIKASSGFDIKEIYLDEITLTPDDKTVAQYGLLEASLPPGADVDQTTWGMSVTDAQGEAVSIGTTSFTAGEKSYSTAIKLLSKPTTVRHLVRFSQAGKFEIPPARFFKMYSPTQKSFEGGNSSANTKITVR